METFVRWDTDPHSVAPATIGTYIVPIHFLRQEFKNPSPQQRLAFDMLESGQFHFRRTRGDGDCYYRSVYVLYLQEMIRRKRLDELIYNFQSGKGIWRVSSAQHADGRKMLIRDLTILWHEPQNEQMAKVQVLLQQPKFDRAFVWEMRYVWANYIHMNKENLDFLQFFQSTSLKAVWQAVLRYQANAASHALAWVANALELSIHQHFLSPQDPYHVTHFNNMYTNDPYEMQIDLLYKPGHYDMLIDQKILDEDGYNFQKTSFNEIQFAPLPYEDVTVYRTVIQRFEDLIAIHFPLNPALMLQKIYQLNDKDNKITDFPFSRQKLSSYEYQVFENIRSVYLGQLQDNQRHGWGLLVSRSHYMVAGQWQNNFVSKGYIMTQKSTYCGSIESHSVDFLEHGHGRLVKQIKNKNTEEAEERMLVYEGEFEHGWFCGRGELVDGSKHYSGTFANNELTGYGKITLTMGKTGRTALLIGNFEDSKNSEEDFEMELIQIDKKGRFLTSSKGYYVNKKFIPKYQIYDEIKVSNVSSINE